MAKLVYTNVRAFVGAADLTASNNKAEISAEMEAKEVTNFASGGFKEFIAGLGSATVDLEGFWEALDLTKIDDAAQAGIGASGPITICPAGAADGATAYFVNALEQSYAPAAGGIGDVAGYKVQAMSTWPLVKGLVMNPPGTARTVTGTGTIQQLGAVVAGDYVYAGIHILSVAGTTPSITFAVESAAAIGFASPTTRLTFNAATAIGSQVLRAAGPITDQYWRMKWTVSGTTPSFLAVGFVGIQ